MKRELSIGQIRVALIKNQVLANQKKELPVITDGERVEILASIPKPAEGLALEPLV